MKKLLRLLPLTWRLAIFFRYKHGYPLNLQQPQTFSEKLQALKLRLGAAEAVYADKLQVRQFVAERIGSQYLIPLLGVYKHANAIPDSLLRQPVAIKTTHGSGLSHLELCPSTLAGDDCRRKFAKALRRPYRGIRFGEQQYHYIPRRILVEQRAYFGELTLTPGSGLEKFEPYAADALWGSLIELPIRTPQAEPDPHRGV